MEKKDKKIRQIDFYLDAATPVQCKIGAPFRNLGVL